MIRAHYPPRKSVRARLLLLLALSSLAFTAALAQIQIRIPKIGGNKPAPAPTPTPNMPSRTGSSSAAPTRNGVDPAARERVKAFHTEIKPYSFALDYFRQAALTENGVVNVNQQNRELVRKYVTELETVGAVCRRYAGIRNTGADDYYCKPEEVCHIAAASNAIYERSEKAAVAESLRLWIGMAEELKTGLERKEGFVLPSGNVMYTLVFERDKGHEMLLKANPMVGPHPPAGYFQALDDKLDALWQEVDRLAPNYAFPTGLPHDLALEAMAKKQLLKTPGVTVLKTAMLRSEWGIAKNSVGLPTERYRTGVILSKMANAPGSNWCRYREFTYRETYSGGGTFAKSDQVRFHEGVRFQKCP